MTPHSVRFVHPSTHPLRVLVVDDDRDCADSLADLLELVGCGTRTCYFGGKALAEAEDFRPDVCVLDLWMPGTDGWELARRLRAWTGDRLLLLIALSGQGGQLTVDKSMGAGFDRHILKPGDPEEMFRDFAAFVARMEGRGSGGAIRGLPSAAFSA